MIVVDTSALVAVERTEEGHGKVIRALRTDLCVCDLTTILECTMVFSRWHADPAGRVAALLDRIEIAREPFTADDLALAQDAFLRYGRGRHPAGLNLGDCMSYALARRLNAPLLDIGDDFTRTDVRSARVS